MPNRFKLIILWFLPIAMSAEDLLPADSVLQEAQLSEVFVTAHRLRSYLKSGDGTTRIDLGLMDVLPQIMGNADPMHHLQLLPGVHTNSEYDAGLYINGSDNSQNDVTINGVTLYNVAHLLGFFSVFNGTHFSSMTLQRQSENAANGNRLGGFVDLCTSDTITSHTGGSLSVGPLSSQGTLRLPVGKTSSLTLSARAAYINLFYSRWLRSDGERYKYFFSDYNINYLYTPTSRDKLWLDAYYGGDRVGTNSHKDAYDVSVDWANYMASLHWQRTLSRGVLYQRAFTTAYSLKPTVHTNEYSIQMPSSIRDWGYHAEWIDSMFNTGFDVTYHRVQPQSPDATGTEFNVFLDPQTTTRALEMSLYAERDFNLWRNRLLLRCGLRLTAWHSDGNWQYAADPNLSFIFKTGASSVLRLAAAMKHQYLHRTGFTSMGLPTEFWLAANNRFRAQHGWQTSVSYETMTPNKTYKFSSEIYFKRLYRQVEYTGSLFDMLYEGYDLDNELTVGNGRNFGINLQIEKRRGKLTGWLSYSWGRALRRFPDSQYQGEYPANHERIHEFNEFATWRLGRRWEFGETFVLASGTPFTAPEYFYLIGHSIISKFADHNANRFRPYMRLDLSVNYKIRLSRPECGVNFSVYNLTFRKNEIFYRLKFSHGHYAYRPVTFVTDVLPSFSFYLKF